jgi:superfamily II DNA or RNA helicase
MQKVLMPNIFQAEALQKLEMAQERGNKSGIVIMPTGIGKTYLASLWFKKQLSHNPKAKLLFLCHNKDILSQANEDEFQKRLKDLNIKFGYYVAREKNLQQCTFATPQTLINNLDKFAPDMFDFIIVDEVHHYQARTFKKVVQHFKPKFLLGLTATPNRTDSRIIYEVCGEKIYEISIQDAIKQNLLSKINYFCVDNDIDFSRIKWDGHQYDERDLNKKICIKEYDEAILKEYKQHLEQDNRNKTICFCASVEHAHRLAKYFNKNGIKSAAMTCTHTQTDKRIIVGSGWDARLVRRKIIQDFKAGKYKIVFVRDLFNEGIDVPNCNSVMLLRPTFSSMIFTQQIGRGLRKSEGKEDVLILDFTGNCKHCEINFQVLSELFCVDIKEKAEHFRNVDHNLKEITIISNGNSVRLSKTKIDILNSNSYGLIPNSEISKELDRVKTLLGREPTYLEFEKLANIDASTVRKRYGSWDDVLEQKWSIKPEQKFRFAKCATCSKEFKTYKKSQQFCSLECRKKHFRFEAQCIQCGKAFTKLIRMKKVRNVQFCSDKCHKDYQKEHAKSKSKIVVIENYKPLTLLPNQIISKEKGKKTFAYKGAPYHSKADKECIRTKIIREINDGDAVLMLESPDLTAIKEIEAQNKKPSKIIIPNHIQFKELAKALKNYKTKLNIELINTSVLQYLADTKESFDFVWLDYCGAFSYYTRDLETLLGKKLNDMKLVLTYNLFDPNKKDDNYYFTRVIDFVLEKVNGRSVRLINDVSYRYKKTMFSIGFVIKKRCKNGAY